MRLDELYQSDTPAISIELFPPKTAEGVDALFKEVGKLKALSPAFFSMTYGAGGSTRDLTLDLCGRLKNQEQVETTCHFNIIGQSREEIRENLARIKDLGIYNLLALRGDPPRDQPNFKPHPDGLTSSVELIEEARRISAEPNGTGQWFSIAVTGFPEKHPEARDRAAGIEYLKRKVEAGGCVIITQLFFDNRYFFKFLGEVRKAGIQVPVIPGILPILSVAQVRRFTSLCGTTIPKAVEKALAKHEQDDAAAAQYGVTLATQMSSELIRAGVPGLHFYALNRASAIASILSNLGLA